MERQIEPGQQQTQKHKKQQQQQGYTRGSVGTVVTLSDNCLLTSIALDLGESDRIGVLGNRSGVEGRESRLPLERSGKAGEEGLERDGDNGEGG